MTQTHAPGEMRTRMRRIWDSVDGIGSRAWAILGVAVVLIAGGYAIALLGWLLWPLAFGIVLGVLAAPLVRWLCAHRVPRVAATTIVFVAMVALLTGITWLIVPPFVEQASRLVAQVPDLLEAAADEVSEFQQRLAGGNPAASNAIEGFSNELRDGAVDFADGLSATFLDIVATTFSIALAGLVGAIVAFLGVKDLPSYSEGLREWLDRPGYERVSGALRQMSRSATGFIRGQLLLAIIVGITTGAVLGFLGVPFFIPLGAVAAVGDLIPTVGPILAAIPAIVIAYSEGGAFLAVVVAIAFTAIQQLESYLLVPLVVGRAVDLPPLTVIVALTVAGGAFGLVGLLVAVPAVAVGRDFVHWFFMSDDEAVIESRRLAGTGGITV